MLEKEVNLAIREVPGSKEALWAVRVTVRALCSNGFPNSRSQFGRADLGLLGFAELVQLLAQLGTRVGENCYRK